MEQMSIALEKLCGGTPQSCQYCCEFFALDFSEQLGKKAQEGRRQFEKRDQAIPDPLHDPHRVNNYKTFLNIDFEDVQVGDKIGCPLCTQWKNIAEKRGVIPSAFALAVRLAQGGNLEICLPNYPVGYGFSFGTRSARAEHIGVNIKQLGAHLSHR
jgi:hypothetical protein